MTSQKKYYCSKAIGDACRNGFSSLSTYKMHKTFVHTIPQQLTGPHPEAQGTYFQKHPVIDGMLWSHLYETHF